MPQHADLTGMPTMQLCDLDVAHCLTSTESYATAAAPILVDYHLMWISSKPCGQCVLCRLLVVVVVVVSDMVVVV